MSSTRNSGAQAQGRPLVEAGDLNPTKDKAPAIGAAQGFSDQDTKQQPDSAHEHIGDQLKKLEQDMRTVERALRKLMQRLGRRSAKTYLTRLKSRKVDPERELARTVSSMDGDMLESFCRCLEQALREGLYARAQLAEAKRLRPNDLEQARFQELEPKFASSGSALLRKEAADGTPLYWVSCNSEMVPTPDLDVAERLLQRLNPSSSSHAAT